MPIREDESNMESDVALIMGIQSGDKQALGKLVERHKRLAYHTALGLVGNKEDAHDISQEAFLRVYNSAKTFDTSQQFLPWFYTIIANLCRTWLRKRTTRDNRMVTIEDAPYLLVDVSNPETTMVAKNRIAELQRALMRLGFEDREIITLQHFRGMTYEEMADYLNIPRGTVMSRLYYARKKLAKLMRRSND